MKFLKKIFGLNGRLDRKGYLLLGVLPMVGFSLLVWVSSFSSSVYSIMIFVLFVLIFILALISAFKRGRDSGLNGLITLVLFALVPTIAFILEAKFKIDIFYVAFLFITYLLFMPSTSKKLKRLGKVEYIITAVFTTLVFLFLIGLFAAPKFICGEGKAKKYLTCLNMKATSNALKMFKLDNGIYPTTDEGISALITNPNALKYPNYAKKSYYKRLPKDAWSAPFVYVKTKDGFELVSYGADRKEGGEDDGADILYSKCEGKR